MVAVQAPASQTVLLAQAGNGPEIASLPISQNRSTWVKGGITGTEEFAPVEAGNLHALTPVKNAVGWFWGRGPIAAPNVTSDEVGFDIAADVPGWCLKRTREVARGASVESDLAGASDGRSLPPESSVTVLLITTVFSSPSSDSQAANTRAQARERQTAIRVIATLSLTRRTHPIDRGRRRRDGRDCSQGLTLSPPRLLQRESLTSDLRIRVSPGNHGLAPAWPTR